MRLRKTSTPTTYVTVTAKVPKGAKRRSRFLTIYDARPEDVLKALEDLITSGDRRAAEHTSKPERVPA